MRPDLRRIKQLSAEQVAMDMGLVHRNVKSPRPDRWAWPASSSAAYIQFYRDGRYRDHKRGIAGGAIDFTIQALAPGNDLDQTYFLDAANKLAAHYNLFEDYEPLIRRSRSLAKNRISGARDFIDGCLAEVISAKNGGERSAEARRFADVLGLDFGRITWAPQSRGDHACLGFSPAVPYQGDRVFYRDGGGYGGWTKERALRFIGEPESLRIYCVDIDGAEGANGQMLIPRIDLIERVVYILAKRDVEARAVILSSFGDEERAKAHLYFVAKKRASSSREFRLFHHHLRQAVAESVASLRGADINQDERDAFGIDEGTHQITRLMRVPGFSKSSKSYAAILFRSEPSAVVDFHRLIERQPSKFKVGETDYHFGAAVKTEKLVKSGEREGETEVRIIARDVYPLALYRESSGDVGVRFAFVSRSGQWDHATISAAAFTDRAVGRKAVSELSKIGVRVAAGSGSALAEAFGHWVDKSDPEFINLIRSPGWHGPRYANGLNIIGPDSSAYKPDESDRRLTLRSGRSGSAAGWSEGVARLAVNPALKLAIGVSFAGALLKPLGAEPFLVHIAGNSSSGKSTAARLGASPWGDPRDGFNSWDSTINGLEILAESRSDACLILDELQRFRGDAKDASSAIHNLTGSRGKARSTRSGDMAQQRSWRVTVLSTGEVTLADWLGEHCQGGHKVRALDIHIQNGEATSSAAHAADIADFLDAEHGHASDAWIHHIVNAEPGSIAGTRKLWLDGMSRAVVDFSSNETDRIAGHLAVIGTALAEGRKAGLLSWSDAEINSLLLWALDKTVPDQDGPRTPEERALRLFHTWFETQPSRFPLADEAEKARDVIGYRVDDPGKPPVILTTMDMIQASGVCTRAGVSAKNFAAWIVDQGHGRRRGKCRIAGIQRRWIEINSDTSGDSDDGPGTAEGLNGSYCPSVSHDCPAHKARI